VVVLGFALAGLAWLGIGVPGEWWPGLVTVSASASVVLLAVFFHPWILAGFVIDAVLLWLVLGADWHAELIATP
jgi:hypothetical protein